MKILHLLLEGPTGLSTRIIDAQRADNEITIIDISRKEASYGDIIDAIVASDSVVSW